MGFTEFCDHIQNLLSFKRPVEDYQLFSEKDVSDYIKIPPNIIHKIHLG